MVGTGPRQVTPEKCKLHGWTNQPYPTSKLTNKSIIISIHKEMKDKNSSMSLNLSLSMKPSSQCRQ